ncbi:13431_t:CDS:1, partial [Dentiscutata heterogama]
MECPREFAINEINTALKGTVDVECKVPQPNVIILEAKPEPHSNYAVHKTSEIYIKDLELNQEDSLDIA